MSHSRVRCDDPFHDASLSAYGTHRLHHFIRGGGDAHGEGNGLECFLEAEAEAETGAMIGAIWQDGSCQGKSWSSGGIRVLRKVLEVVPERPRCLKTPRSFVSENSATVTVTVTWSWTVTIFDFISDTYPDTLCLCLNPPHAHDSLYTRQISTPTTIQPEGARTDHVPPRLAASRA